MWVPPAVFVGVLGMILGAYWFLVVREESSLIERLQPRSASARAERSGVLLRAEERLSSVEPLQALLKRSGAATSGLKRLLEQSGLRLTVGVFVLATGCVALLAYLAVSVLTGLPLVGLIAGLLGGAVPYFLVKRARTKRMLKFEEQFPEAIDLIARALRAGHALSTGLEMVGDELPKPVGTEFRKLFDEQNFGLTLPEALHNFAARVPVLDARFFVTAVLTQREAGGNLAEVLDNLAGVIRERFKIKRQVRVISAHGRITGWILTLLPPSLAVAIFFISPHHLEVLTHDPIGVRMIETALVLQTLGTLIVRKIVNVEY